MKTKPKRASTSGTNLTDKQRDENGWGRLSLRVKKTTLAKLDAIAGPRERAKCIEGMIDRDHAALTKRKP